MFSLDLGMIRMVLHGDAELGKIRPRHNQKSPNDENATLLHSERRYIAICVLKCL